VVNVVQVYTAPPPHATFKEPTGVLNAATNSITAQPNHFSSWAVLGQMRQASRASVYLPVIRR
jgi:hypothetical protein